MKNNKKYILFFSTVLLVAACSNESVDEEINETGDVTGEAIAIENSDSDTSTSENEEGKTTVHLTASEEEWSLNEDLSFDAWVYNNTLPGEEIRVQEGEEVEIKLKNDLPVPTALHLHGIPLDHEMDGVPGISQNVVMPGDSFTYEFTADAPGTYWYHSHQDGATQVEKGLYGPLVIETEDDQKYDIDEVLVLDDYSSMMEGMEDRGNMEGMMDHESHGAVEEMTHDEMMAHMYDTMLINGKASPEIERVEVQEGDAVKLRFVNAGLFTQVIQIPDHNFKVTHYDGQKVNEPETLSNTSVTLGAAERVDIEIEANNPGAYGVEIFADTNKDNLHTVLPFVYEDYTEEELATREAEAEFDILSYGKLAESLNLDEVTKEFDMVLDSEDGGEIFTINNKKMDTETAEGHEVYEVEEGDVVKMTIANETEVDHPMHLHGHFFQVISRNGEKVSGSPIIMETLNVREGEEYEIILEADNPGNWLFHCHEFHHASNGMASEIKYEGFEPSFTPDPNAPNKPE
ncbi:multicopper oxidase family protein [Thalassorhabdus alkalitolerans]|uniref:Multicopper oxidase family protein n=1 Tax=Thalassorhabdus alkalitolerans TaxID=2282697 RepID=A0ABW0YHI4_9BACI